MTFGFLKICSVTKNHSLKLMKNWKISGGFKCILKLVIPSTVFINYPHSVFSPKLTLHYAYYRKFKNTQFDELMDNEIEIQMKEDNYDGVRNMVPSVLEYILQYAESLLDSDIVCFSSHLISLFCIFYKTVHSFEFRSDEDEELSNRYNSAIDKTKNAIQSELGLDHDYIHILNKLYWKT